MPKYIACMWSVGDVCVNGYMCVCVSACVSVPWSSRFLYVFLAKDGENSSELGFKEEI